MNTVSVKFELPTIVASQAGLNLENINQEVKLMFAMFLYEHKRISLSKACEIGGVKAYWRSGVSGTCLSFDSYSSAVTLPAPSWETTR